MLFEKWYNRQSFMFNVEHKVQRIYFFVNPLKNFFGKMTLQRKLNDKTE